MKQTNITKKLLLAVLMVVLLAALFCFAAGAETKYLHAEDLSDFEGLTTSDQAEIKAESGLYLTDTFASVTANPSISITDGALTIVSSQGYAQWYTSDGKNDSSDFFKTLFGEGGYRYVTLQFDFMGTPENVSASDANGSLLRLQMFEGTDWHGQRDSLSLLGAADKTNGTRQPAVFTFGGRAGTLTQGFLTDIDFEYGKQYHLRYEFDTQKYIVIAYVTFDGEEVELGRANYEFIADQIKADYASKVGGTATTLDDMVKALTAEGIQVQFILGRGAGRWTTHFDNLSLSVELDAETGEQIVPDEDYKLIYRGICGAQGDNLTWTLDDETGELVISGTGAMMNYPSAANVPWSSSRSSIKTVTIKDSVTSIGDYAFSYCTSLTNVVIPDSVTSIGSYAFYRCRKLIEVINKSDLKITKGKADNGYVAVNAIEVHNGESKIVEQDGYLFYTYNNVNYLVGYVGTQTELVLPETYNDQDYRINTNAFYGDSLTSVTLPATVTSIGKMAFSECSALTKIEVEQGNPVYHSAGNCIIETESKTLIAGCQTSVIPNGGSVTSIGDYAFYICENLPEVTIPEGVTSIGRLAFYQCKTLVSIHLPKTVTSIKDNPFMQCFGLTAITVDEQNPVYHSAGTCIVETESKTLVVGNGCSTIPADGSVTKIGSSAFSECFYLTSIVIPDSVTSIGSQSFSHCYDLTSITIPESVTSIGDRAFYYCSELKDVTVLSKTTKIYDNSKTITSSDTTAAATIYGYAGSLAQAYAEKYGRTFVALKEPANKTDGALIAYQVTAGENGTFALRAISGLDSLDYLNYGFEITVTTKDADGNDVTQTVSSTSDKVYSSVYGGNDPYSIKKNFGYRYAGLATITGLAADSTYTKIEIRSFVTTMSVKARYAKACTLLYTGETNADGFPALTVVTQ